MTFLHHLTAFKPELVSQIEATVTIDNDPYTTLTVENIGPGPRGLPGFSICHYGEQNGDPIARP